MDILKVWNEDMSLTLSWPAGRICPTYEESFFEVRWDNSIPLFLHAAIYLEVSIPLNQSECIFPRNSHVQMILCAKLHSSIAQNFRNWPCFRHEAKVFIYLVRSTRAELLHIYVTTDPSQILNNFVGSARVQMILCAMLLCSITHSIISTRLFRGKMHSDWFNGIDTSR